MWPFSKATGPDVNAEAVSQVLFHPRREPATGGLEPTETDSGGVTVGGLWLERADSDGVVLFFHGNGELAVDWAGVSGRLAEAFGACVWLADYRGYGRSGGGPSYGAMLKDAEAMWRELDVRGRQRGRKFRRRWVMGRSLGSAAAIHVAWRFPESVTGLVVESGFARLPALLERLGGQKSVWSPPGGFSDNADKLASCRMPTLFLHGAADRIIPVEAARENWAASGAPDKRLIAVEGAGHNDLEWKGGPEYWGAIRRLTGR